MIAMIGIRMGHLKNVDQGACGLVNEYDVNRAYTPYLHAALNRCGIDTIDCTPENASSMGDSLAQGVSKANDYGVELFISCHVNAFYTPDAHGCEVIYNSEYEKKLAGFIQNELVGLGFTDRGIMPNTRELYEIKHTNMSTVIVEPFFCTSPNDVSIYNNVGDKAIGEAIAKGICSYLGKEYIPEAVIKDSGIVTGNQVFGGNLEIFFKADNGKTYIGTVKLENIIMKG